MSGLRSMVSYSASEPRAKVKTTLPGSSALRAPVTQTAFGTGRRAVGQHLGVDAEILTPLSASSEQTAFGMRADADLQAGAVLDLAGR